MIDALTGGTATGFLWWAIPLRIDLLYRSRICLLLAFGCNGAFGTAHEPGVGRYTGYGRGLLDGELERLRHAQQDGASLIAGLGDLAEHLLDPVGVQRLAFRPSKSFLALQRDHTAIMDAKLPGKVRVGNVGGGVIIAYQEVRTVTGFIQARCSNLLRGVG